MTSENNDIKNIIRDIESGKNTHEMIMEKYNLTTYKYYKLLKDADIKNPCSKLGAPPGPRDTPFKKLLNQGNSSDIENFNVEEFKEDCVNGMKLSELMDKYSLSLYQVRELRKKYELKTR